MIKLFRFESCPFCAKVITTLDELNLKDGVDYKLVDAKTKQGKAELLELGGELQVPFLVDNETMMYESADICEYLERKFVK